MRKDAVSKPVWCPGVLWHLRTPHWGQMSNQDVSTLLRNTATIEGTCTAPLCQQLPAQAPEGCITREHCKNLDLGDNGEWSRRAPCHAALPTPPKPITTARMNEFGYKEYILLPHILYKSQSGRWPGVQCEGGDSSVPVPFLGPVSWTSQLLCTALK